MCSLSLVYAQDVEQNRSIMTMVQAASDRYLSASGSAEALDQATSRAVASMSNQISQYVANAGRGIDDEVAHEVTRTFSDTQLSDYQFLVVKKPQGDDKDYTVFVFIGKARVDEIVAEIKETVQEANSARAKQADADLRFYYGEACRAIKDYRIGDALKYLYWSYVISLDTQAVLEEDGRSQLATVLIEAKMERLLKNINISVVSFTKEQINDFQERYKAVLNIEYVQDGIAHKVTNLDYEYYDGITMKGGPRVRDGVGTLDLQYGMDQVNFQIVYKYGESETPPEVYALVQAKGKKTFASATKTIAIPMMVEEQPQPVSPQAIEETLVTDDNSSVAPVRDHGVMLSRIQAVEQAIRRKDYLSVKAYFTEDGFDSFKKLVQYGSATIIGTPQYRFMDFGQLTLCRSITMQFRFRNNKQFIESVTFRFNDNNLIESLAFTLSDVAEGDILDKGNWSRDSRLTLMTFLEDYQTAYALGRIDYLERIFSENALIIVGNKVERRVENKDRVIIMPSVKYDTLSKAQYMDRLRRHFNTKEYINLNFTETDFERASNGMEFYGIRVRQEYFSNTYGDVGYLFLLVDLRYDEPVIHVRAWQNDKLPLDALFGMTDCY